MQREPLPIASGSVVTTTFDSGCRPSAFQSLRARDATSRTRPCALALVGDGLSTVKTTTARGSDHEVTVPPYLSTEQLSQLTPWTVQAINTMWKRGILKRGVHYYQPMGRGGQVIFKWSAVVELIETRVCQRQRWRCR